MITASPQLNARDCGSAMDDLDIPVSAKPFSIDEKLATVALAAKRLRAIA
jgi:hypothetical protein